MGYSVSIPKNEFRIEIVERIRKGKELCNNTPSNLLDYSLYSKQTVAEYKSQCEAESQIFFIEYRKWNSINIRKLESRFCNPDNCYLRSYNEVSKSIVEKKELTFDDLAQIIKLQISVLEELIETMDLLEYSSDIESLQSAQSKVGEPDYDNAKVFLVHGHDDLAISETARFIENLGLEAIILREQANQGQTIIEKIDTYSNVGFGIVLYTPCDKGGLNKDDAEIKPRARQNVVFEHGYLIGKIGRERVCALVKNKVETPGDISGVVYIKMDEYGGWKTNLANEMKSVGYEIDMNKIK